MKNKFFKITFGNYNNFNTKEWEKIIQIKISSPSLTSRLMNILLFILFLNALLAKSFAFSVFLLITAINYEFLTF